MTASWERVERALRKIRLSTDSVNEFLDQRAQLRPAELHLEAAWQVWTEALNGGLHQFFLNDSGMMGPEAAAGLRALGLPAAAELLEQALAKLGDPYPREEDRRRHALERLGRDPFASLDGAFQEALGDFDLRADAFVRAQEL